MREKEMFDQALIVFLAGIVLVLVFLTKKDLPPLPPGPRSLPLLGNVFQLKKKYMWKLANDWYREYGTCNSNFRCLFHMNIFFFVGKVVYANAAGIPLIFLNDFQANDDLINGRWDKYADRPKMVMLNELCSGKYIVSIYIVPSLTRLTSL